MPTVEDIIKIIVLVILAIFVLANTVFVLFFTQVGLVALFVLVFAFVIFLSSGTTLLAVDFLYPEAVAFVSLVDLLQLILPTSLAATFLLLWSEELAVGLSRRAGLNRARVEMGSVVACGGVYALLLGLQARFMSGAELKPGAALTAGLIGIFAFYCVELFTVHAESISGKYLEPQNDEQLDSSEPETIEADQRTAPECKNHDEGR